MNKLCIVTVADDADYEWLAELFFTVRVLAASVKNWKIVWSVQDDSGTKRHGWLENRSAVVSYGANDLRLGKEKSTEMALQRHTDSSAIIHLDQDDMIFVDGLKHSMAVMAADPNLAWVAGSVAYRQDGGQNVHRRPPFEDGPVSCGGDFAAWIKENADPHYLGFLYRFNAWSLVGESFGSKGAVDVCSGVIKLCEMFDGWVHQETVVVYRDFVERKLASFKK